MNATEKPALIDRMVEISGSEKLGKTEYVVVRTTRRRGFTSHLYLSSIPYLFSGFSDRAFVFARREQAQALIKEYPDDLSNCAVEARER